MELGGYIPYCDDHPEKAFAVNLLGTRRLLEATQSVPSIERMVFTSSTAVYSALDGPPSQGQLVDDPGGITG
ncbi:NAD-dependent epimerase/dehydratase family protein [Halalkalicoccus subterraneus]|uniref:NAD-dependent epimerase/dehydratase family protein n=1 Tax=Halalkalicoccus subterraneus TaxID=2675002 RepID=UPI000EFA367C|nr:NAD-dependent epimerase/dehydratase family protein [Halalkalicoccus subterraneus]